MNKKQNLGNKRSHLVFFLPMIIILFHQLSYGQEPIETKYYTLKIDYWFNMHHFLYQEALLREVDSSAIDIELAGRDVSKLNTALEFYSNNIIEKDLRTDDFLGAFKWYLYKNTGIKKLDSLPDDFKKLSAVLKDFDSTYRNNFWEVHKAHIKKTLTENLSLIKSTEEDFVEKITAVTQQYWDAEKVPVFLTYYGKISKRNRRNRPYTNIFPTFMVMNTFGDNDVKGNWIELLYHESAHPLILGSGLFVGGTINDVAETNNLKVPRGLWHAYLFYFTGKISQELLEDNGVSYPKTYMRRNGIFGKYYPFLKEHLDLYLDRKVTLAEVTLTILQKLNK